MQRHTERIEICCRIGRRALEHFGSRVLQAPSRRRLGACEADIDQERPARLGWTGKHRVLRFHIAVNDAPPVQVTERARDLREVAHHHRFRETAQGGEILLAVLECQGAGAAATP